MTKDDLADGTVSSLFEICFKTSLRYLESSQLPKNESLFLPEEVCQALISQKIKMGTCSDDFIAKFFADVQTSRMTRANLSCTAITDAGVELISRHCLREVDVSKCEALTSKSIEFLLRCKDSLVFLNVSYCRQINYFSGLQHFTKLKSLDLSRTFIDQREFDSLCTLVHLRRLNISGTHISSLEPVRSMCSLTSLDLSNCDDLESVEPLVAVKGTLCWLSLYNCRRLEADEMLVTLQQLMQLQHLDLSRDDPDESVWFQSFLESMVVLVDEEFLEELLPCLPNLTSLDISGNARFKYEHLQLFRQHCKQRLQFLGLFQTNMYRYREIPAEQVSGNANLSQITLSMEVYKNRPKFLISALQELFSIIRQRDHDMDINSICRLVLGSMENHSSEKKIQLAGSASLYHLSRDDDENPNWQLSMELKRRVIEATLNAMENHVKEAQLQKNCCLTLCNFRIPDEVSCNYKRIVELLLRAALVHHDDFIQRTAIALCNLLVCQVQDSQKIIVGRDLQGVEKILNIMRYKMGNNPASGGVLECCWSALWNVTDETPENCALFLSNRGLELFMRCNKELSDQRDLVRNMLGLMGNVAEVPELRPQLMTLAHVFYDLLLINNPSELEVTYNAGGIISHLAFDGPDCWTNTVVTREEALRSLEEIIETWDIRARRQMSYRSFAPILRLISGCGVTAIHHWATWALANLCNVDAEKYCKLVRDEGGMELLQGLTANPNTSQRVRELSQMTLDKCYNNLEHLENSAQQTTYNSQLNSTQQ